MILHVQVKAGSNKNSVAILDDGKVIVKIKAAAQEGKANKELIKFLSEILEIPKSTIEIISGVSAPFKKLQIDGDEKIIRAKLISSAVK